MTDAHPTNARASALTKLLAAAAIGATAATAATAKIAKRVRHQHQQQLIESNERARVALEELQTEEMRVRRLVSDQLHGTLQNRMAIITAGIDGVARALAQTGDQKNAEQLTELAAALDQLREREVRDLSHAVFPAGIELGAVRAIEAMVHRLPPQIAANLTLGPNLQQRVASGIPMMPLAERLIVVSAIEEAITNALKHGGATAISLELEVTPDPAAPSDHLILTGVVADNGRGLPPGGVPSAEAVEGLPFASASFASPALRSFFSLSALPTEAGSNRQPQPNRQQSAGSALESANPAKSITGLSRHADRLLKRGGQLRLWSPPDGGTRLEFALPLPQEYFGG